MKFKVLFFCALAAAAVSCGQGGGKSLTGTTYTNPVISHDCPDPTVIDDRGRTGYFYAYSTRSMGKTLPIYRSKDFVNWEDAGDGFPNGMSEWMDSAALWAPDINYVDGKYILYYAKGVWGDAVRSASGVAVSDSPTGPFEDKGMVVSFQNTGVGNSIDPMLFIDEDGKKYLYWGSYGETSGVWVVELADDCLKIKEGAKPVQVAYSNCEGTYVIKRNGFYYMFGSKGSCCEGARSNYRIVVSRSKSPMGPFSGPDGSSPMDKDYGCIIMSSSPDSTFIGTGHDAQIITDDAGEDWMPYHSYWRGNGYKGRCMLIDRIVWDNGWPRFASEHPTLSGEGPKWRMASRAGNDFMVSQVDPLTKIVIPQNNYVSSDDTVLVARGENAVLQLVISSPDSISGLKAELKDLRSGSSRLDEAMLGWVRYVGASLKYAGRSRFAIDSQNNLYPDPILTDTTWSAGPASKAILWVDIPIPQDAAPGLYKGRVKISGKKAGRQVSAAKDIFIKVYPVAVSSQSLYVTNWFGTSFSYMNGGVAPEPYSQLYWDCLDSTIRMTCDYCQNTWLLGILNPQIRDGKIEYDFSTLGKTLDIIESHARDIKAIEGTHLGGRKAGEWTDPFVVFTPVIDNGAISTLQLPPSDPRAKEFISTFISRLSDYLRSRKLPDGSGRTYFDIYLQHVADEPINENLESWNAIARLVKEAAPGIRIIDACQISNYDKSLLDVPVPEIDFIAQDAFAKDDGQERWFYTCTGPRGEFANRFLDQPLLDMRILHWMNFKYGFAGYLHWGFNRWEWSEDPYAETASLKTSWPGGDPFIVYPGYHKLYPSIRLEQMRNGIRDYELLKMAEAKDPAKAHEFADRLILGYDSYDLSIPHFRELRRDILEYLSQE